MTGWDMNVLETWFAIHISSHNPMCVCMCVSKNRFLNSILNKNVLSNFFFKHSAENESKIIVLDMWSTYMLDSICVYYNEIYKHFILLMHHQFIYGILFYSVFYFA